MDRRLGHPGEGQRAGRGDRLDVARSRHRVVARGYVSALQGRGDSGVEQDRILAMDLEHAAVAAHGAHRLEETLIRQSKVEDHERLRSRDARLDRGRELGDRVVGMAADREAEADIDCAVAVRRRTPFADPGQQRSLRRR